MTKFRIAMTVAGVLTMATSIAGAQGRIAVDPRYGASAAGHDPRYPTVHSNGNSDPRFDARSNAYDPRLDPRSRQYDPRYAALYSQQTQARRMDAARSEQQRQMRKNQQRELAQLQRQRQLARIEQNRRQSRHDGRDDERDRTNRRRRGNGRDDARGKERGGDDRNRG